MRSPSSAADAELIEALAAKDLRVSSTQLERWRHRGLLPRANVTRLRGGGTRVEAHPELVYEIAAVLSFAVERGGAWQVGGLELFERGLPLEETLLRECLRWLHNRSFRAARRVWAEAASEMSLRVGRLSPDDVADVAALAERLAHKHKPVRHIRGVVRQEFLSKGYVRGDPETVRRAANEALGLRLAALAGAPLDDDLEDIARYGSGGAPPRGMTPVLPHEWVACAETLTLREASCLARINFCAIATVPEAQYLEDMWLLDLACVDVASQRLNTFPYSVTTPLAGEHLREMERNVAESERELDRMLGEGLHLRQGLLPFDVD